jgi:hypothetical protein
MIFLLLLALCLAPKSYAKSMRTVHLSEKDMETVLVEPGYSTLIKFDSHPEPGLIGDQDAFKVEYMKNMVAIKPLASKGQTNLFLFTKEGQFNFQLVAGRGRHDNIVYAQAGAGNSVSGVQVKPAILVDDLLTRKIGKAASQNGRKLVLESIATPISRSTLVLHILIEQPQGAEKVLPEMLSLSQGKKKVTIENVFLESRQGKAGISSIGGLLLIRADALKRAESLRLELQSGKPGKPLWLQFSPDFGRR